MYRAKFDKRLELLTALLLVGVAWLLIPGRAAWACGGTDPTVLCVDTDANPSSPGGLSWTEAYTNVQDALDDANTNGNTDYEIWVAEGVYYPDVDSDGGHADNSEGEYFTLSYNNVQLYGGFAGNEDARGDRDWEAYVTVLSGDLQQDDTTDANGMVTDTGNISGTNAYHVLWLDGVTNETITETTVIDGFTITAGQADGSSHPHNCGGGLYCAGNGSGSECSPALTNVTFSGNHAGTGGGMYNFGMNGVSSPALTNVIFKGNHVEYYGGGMYNYGYSGDSSPALTNVTFSGNQASYDGGGMYNDGYNSGESSPALTNVILWGNTADDGNQMYNNSATPVLSYTLIQSGTEHIYNNDSTVTYGAGILTEAPCFVDAETGNLRLRPGSPAAEAGDDGAVAGVSTDLDGNLRIQGLAVDLGAYEAASSPHLRISKRITPEDMIPYHGVVTTTLTLSNWGALSDTHVLFTDTLPSAVDFAAFVGADHGASVSNDEFTWSGTVTTNHTLTWTLTLTHTGGYANQVMNTAELSSTWQQEVAQAHFWVEDITAAAVQLYVDAGKTVGGDGATWATAYRYLQTALDRAKHYPDHDYEIWVAEGVYYPDEGIGHTPDSEDEYFTIEYNNVQLYGGFDGAETARDQRDWETYVTVLSGDIDTDAGGADINTDGNYVSEVYSDTVGSNADHVLWLDGVTNETITETTVIDGFTITAGQADGSNLHDYGGGLYCAGNGNGSECSPALTNVTFSGNQAIIFGGGMFNYGSFLGDSSPTLTNVIFSGNQANNGGGMFNYGGNSGESSPALTNVIFSDNQANNGGGVLNYGFNGGESSPALTNVTFSGNWAGDSGGGMYNDGSGGDSSPALTNVILWGNEAITSGRQLYNNFATPVLSYTLIQSGTEHICNSDSTVTYGDGVLTSDPQFVAPITTTAAPTTTGDYRLQAGSPAIDAGDDDAINATGVTIDLDGNPRIVGGAVDMGAYEAQPDLELRKTVTPTQNAAYHGAVTYTVVLSNSGACIDTNVLFTDTLTAQPVDFASWVISPTHTYLNSDEITWTGLVTASDTLTWTWIVTHTGDYGDVVTNTAEFSGTLQVGADDAVFTVPSNTIYLPLVLRSS